MKKIISILCVITMLFGTVSYGMTAKATTQADTHLSLSDFHDGSWNAIKSGFYSYKKAYPPQNTHANLLGKTFSVYLYGVGGHIRYASDFSEVGYQVKINTKDQLVFTDYGFRQNDEFYLTAAEAGVADFASPFKLSITLNAVEHDDDGNQDDLEFGFYINDNLCKTVYCDDQKAEQARNHGFLMLNNIYVYEVEDYDTEAYKATALETIGANEITVTDFHLKSGTYPTAITGANYGVYSAANGAPKSIVNTTFNADVMFESSSSTLIYPKNKNDSGMKLSVDGQNLVITDGIGLTASEGYDATITASEAGNVALVGNTFNLKIKVASFTDNGTPKIKLCYYINQTLVYEGTTENVELFESLQEQEAPYYVGRILLSGIKVCQTPPVLFETTPANIGLAYQRYTTDSVSTSILDLDNKVFTTDIQFHSTDADGTERDNSVFNFGSAVKLWYNRSTNDLRFSNTGFSFVGEPENFDVSIGKNVDEQFNLKISTERMDYDGDGYADDLKLGIFINDVLCNDKYYYSIDGFEKMIPIVCVHDGVELMKPKQAPTYLRDVAPIDVDIADTTKSLTAAGYLANSWFQAQKGFLDALFTTNLTLDNAVNYEIWYGSTSSAIRFVIDPQLNFVLRDAHSIYATVPSSSLGITNLTGTPFKLQISLQRANADLNGDGKSNDLRVGFFVNDQLVSGTFYHPTTANADTYYTGYLNGMNQLSFYTYSTTGAGIKIQSPQRTLPETGYTEITPADFGMEDGTYQYVNSTLVANATLPAKYGTFNDKILSTKLKLTNASWITLGGNCDGGAVRFVYDGNGNVSLSDVINGKDTFGSIKSGKVPTTQFDFQVTTRYANGDVQLGIWIDGKLFSNKYFYLVGDASYVQPKFGIYASSVDAAKPTTVEVGVTGKEVEACLDEGAYTVSYSTAYTTTVNDTAISENQEINFPGVYSVVMSGTQFNGTKTVIAYKLSDANEDNTVNVKDLVRAKNAASDASKFKTKAGRLSLGLQSEAESITDDVLRALRMALLK